MEAALAILNYPGVHELLALAITALGVYFREYIKKSAAHDDAAQTKPQ